MTVNYGGSLPVMTDAGTGTVYMGFNTSGGDLPPTAKISATETGTSSVTVTFDGSGSSDPDGTIASYQWNFGDGSAGLSGAMVQHTYTKPGTFTATLTVTDNSGSTGTAQYPVTVADTTPPTNPTNLTDTITTKSSGGGKHKTTTTYVNLSWGAATDNSGSVSYKIYRNGALLTSAASASYSDATTKTGVLYSYYVIAVDPSGNASGSSNILNVQR